ncbi:MAG: helix-hairpin-helix domain-containing protein [Eubacteriales bacterium]|nr:helix-hairpin-helix domain-containing protein [Eubacteriales bacterium]
MKFNSDRKLKYKIIAGVILLLIAFFVLFVKDHFVESEWITIAELENCEEITENSETEATLGKEDQKIVVDVAGEVNNPSVYILPQGSRVYECIEAAGGLTKDADTRNTNLAALLTDGIKLYIPNQKEAEEIEKKIGSSSAAKKSNVVNINTAGSEELQQLPGVGPATAEKIINYRDEYGRFNRKEDLKNVSGIGEKTFEKIKNRITVE